MKHLLSFGKAYLVTTLGLGILSTAQAGTVSIMGASASILSWSDNFPGGGPSTLTQPGVYTFQTTGGRVLPLVHPSSVGVSGSAASTDNMQFTWDLKWIPSNPSDVPPLNVYVKQRYKYSVRTSGLGALNNINNASSEFLDLNGGLPNLIATILGPSIVDQWVQSTTFVDGSTVTITGTIWTLQLDGTYNATVVFEDSFIRRVAGGQTSPVASRKQLNMQVYFDIQTTLTGVGTVAITPWL